MVGTAIHLNSAKNNSEIRVKELRSVARWLVGNKSEKLSLERSTVGKETVAVILQNSRTFEPRLE